MILFAALFAALQRNYPGVLGRINPGLAGLSISYALQVRKNNLLKLLAKVTNNSFKMCTHMYFCLATDYSSLELDG